MFFYEIVMLCFLSSIPAAFAVMRRVDGGHSKPKVVALSSPHRTWPGFTQQPSWPQLGSQHKLGGMDLNTGFQIQFHPP